MAQISIVFLRKRSSDCVALAGDRSAPGPGRDAANYTAHVPAAWFEGGWIGTGGGSDLGALYRAACEEFPLRGETPRRRNLRGRRGRSLRHRNYFGSCAGAARGQGGSDEHDHGTVNADPNASPCPRLSNAGPFVIVRTVIRMPAHASPWFHLRSIAREKCARVQGSLLNLRKGRLDFTLAPPFCINPHKYCRIVS